MAFTLIELLAVILILGVIALIVTPVIIGVINKQKRKTFETSIRGIIKGIDIDLSDDSFNVPREYYYNDGTLTLIEAGNVSINEEVKMNGKIYNDMNLVSMSKKRDSYYRRENHFILH